MKNKFLFLPTLKINLLRGFFSGIVFSIFILFIPGPEKPFKIFILIPFFFPVWNLFWFFLYYPLQLFKLGGVAAFILFFSSILGDPLLFILFKIKPEWQPIDKFNILNFAGLILVNSNNITDQKKGSNSSVNESCPFKGKISIHKDVNWGGLNWSTSEIAFEINEDWKVYNKGSKFGWIDRNGDIHKNPLIGDVNLDATLSDPVVAKIFSNMFYINNDHVGDLYKY